jgi:hypothetical protein
VSKFPKTIYVTVCRDEDEILIADRDHEGAENNEAVAVYQLVSVNRKIVNHDLGPEAKPARKGR